MAKKKVRHHILINAVDPEECRIALVRDGRLENFSIETAAGELTRGNIYKGVVTRVEPSLQAAFVNYGAEKNGFLQQREIHSDYFVDQTRAGKNATPSITDLIEPRQELLVQVTKEPVANKGAMLTTFISLPGRYAVLMPGGKGSGVSRKMFSRLTIDSPHARISPTRQRLTRIPFALPVVHQPLRSESLPQALDQLCG